MGAAIGKEASIMCVIVTAAPGAMPEPEDILAMSEANPDGGGVSWWNGERLRGRFRALGSDGLCQGTEPGGDARDP